MSISRDFLAGGFMKIKGSILLVLFGVSCYAQSQVYKHVDKDGKISYSNAPLKDAKKLDLPPLTVIPAIKPKAKMKIPVSPDTAATGARRVVIEERIAEEAKFLEEIKKEYNNGEPDRSGSERNYQRYLDRVQQLKDGIAFHEENIRALRLELQGLDDAIRR